MVLVLYHPPAHFALVIFGIGSCVYAQASLDCDPPSNTFQIAGMTGAQHQHPAFIG
jgi:hypothetical protein